VALVERSEEGPSAELVVTLAVAAGGALGAGLRWAVASWWPWRPPGFPWATVTVNVVGCLAIGVVLAWLLGSVGQPRWLRPFLATGVLGGFTTFSAFAVESVRLVDSGSWATALTYVVVSLVLGLVAVRVGVRAVVVLRGT
jgi:CrcB protein